MKTVLMGSNLARITAMLLLLFAHNVSAIYLLVLLLHLASAAYLPAFQALIPRVLDDGDDYSHGLALSRLATDTEMLFSPQLAAAVLLIAPTTALYALGAAGLDASVVLLSIVRFPTAPASTAAESSALSSAASSEAVASTAASAEATTEATAEAEIPAQALFVGFKLFIRIPQFRALIAAQTGIAAVMSVVLVNNVIIVQSRLGLSESAAALFLAINGAGSILMATQVPKLLARYGVRNVIRAALFGPPSAVFLLQLPSLMTQRQQLLCSSLFPGHSPGCAGAQRRLPLEKSSMSTLPPTSRSRLLQRIFHRTLKVVGGLPDGRNIR